MLLMICGQVEHYSIDTSNLKILGFDGFISTEKIVVNNVQQILDAKD
jgi:hypothetical protein